MVRTMKRVVVGRRLRQTGEERRVVQRQVPRLLREVGLCRGLDAVRVVPVEDLVHVGVENPGLRLLARELDREACLCRLAPERLRRLLDVKVARELLRDRRPALDDVAGADVGDERAGDPGVVERAVLPESPVLDCDRRLRKPCTHLREGHRLPVLLGGDRTEQRAVRGEDERVLSDLYCAKVAQLAARHPDGGAREAADDEEQEGADQQPEQDPRRPLMARLRARAAPFAPAGDDERVGGGAPAAAAARRAHANTPSARSAAWARSRSSCSRSSASRSPAGARTTTLAFPARPPT